MAERKLELSALLRAIDNRDGDWFAKQPEDAKKEFAPLVIQRFVATVNDGPEASLMLVLVNERVNLHLFDLHKHPDLAYRLLASCGLGKMLKHQWLAGHKRKAENNKAYDLLAKQYPEANDRELTFLMAQHTKNSFADLLSERGIQAAEAKEIMQAYDKING